MNSKETLTCNLFHLPQDIFRVIFQYLSVNDLMKGEEAFLNNQELLSLYRSSLQGFILKEENTNQDEEEYEKLIPWVIDHKLLVGELDLYYLSDIEMNLLNHIRFSLKSIHFSSIYPGSDNSISVIPQLGHFPLLTSVTFSRSKYFTKDKLISFFSHNPQLEIVEIHEMQHLSNKIIPHLSNDCPKIRILSLYHNDWVNDETISLLTQPTLFPNLKSLDLQRTEVRNQESLRQFILSHPLLCGLLLPNRIQYSEDFLVFYLRQVIIPSILSSNDLESHSLAISSLSELVGGVIFEKRNDVVNPEIFTVDILSHLYHKGRPTKTLKETTEIFYHLSKFPSMIDSILQSQFIPFFLNDTRPDDYLPFVEFGDLLFRCGIFHDYFPLLVEKYRTYPSSLIKIFHQVIRDHFSLMTAEEVQIMIPIVLNKLPDKDYTHNCLEIISKLLNDPSSQLLIDPNNLLLLFKSIDFVLNYKSKPMIDCLEEFISVNENYQQLLIESYLIPQMMIVVDPQYLMNFTKHCLSLSRFGLLVDHLVDIGLFQYLLANYSQFSPQNKNQMKDLVKQLLKFKNYKYSEIVNEMELLEELRVKLFEKREEEELTR